MPKVSVIDYGMGNLFSVMRAIEFCGGTPVIIDNPENLKHAEIVILPGVGAFGDGMMELNKRNFVSALLEYVDLGRPLLGICLGMQLLLTRGEEFGDNDGLGVIPGRVVAIPPTGVDGTPHQVPHVGWNEIVTANGERSLWDATILSETQAEASVYFVHSYYTECDDPAFNLAVCDYNGRRLGAVIRKDKTYGCQFHPEKSGPVGLNILKKFIDQSS